MKNCYILYPHSLKLSYIIKALKKKGFNILGLKIYDTDFLLKNNKKALIYFINKQMTSKEMDDFENVKYINLKSKREIKNDFFLRRLEIIDIKSLILNPEDRLLSFDERFLFEASLLDKNFLGRKHALIYSCKHMMYKRINRSFIKIKNINDFEKIPEGKFIFKPSLDSIGKKNVFIIENKKDIQKIIAKNPEILSLNRTFILEKYIEHVSEIWAMTLFDQ